MQAGDTIVAISSPPVPSARIIVRLSGPRAGDIVSNLSAVPLPASGASRIVLNFREMTLPALAYRFPAPRSYTAEEIVELHIPGNPLLAQLLLRQLYVLGARAADAGEFTARAYFAGRIDLTEAEGVAAAIHAQGESELSAARRLMAGELTRRLEPISEQVAQMLALVEAGIDFSDEDISFLASDEICRRIDRMEEELKVLSGESERFERLAHEPVVVLAGRPNAGKSTLLNALAAEERAVVSPISGTTRDAIWAQVPLRRGMVRITDIAGLTPPEAQTDDELSCEEEPPATCIEKQMRSQAIRAIESAEVVALVIDASDNRPPIALPRTPDLVIRSKIDLLTDDAAQPVTGLPVSARSGAGIAELKRALDRACFGPTAADPTFALNTRHFEAIHEARAALSRARERAAGGLELLAAELRETLDRLGEISGHVSPDDLLGRVFSSFCIGK